MLKQTIQCLPPDGGLPGRVVMEMFLFLIGTWVTEVCTSLCKTG